MRPELGQTQQIEKQGRMRRYRTPVRGQENTQLETEDTRTIWKRVTRARTTFTVTVIENGTTDDRIPDGQNVQSPLIVARSPRSATVRRWEQIQRTKAAATAKETKTTDKTKTHAA